MSRTRSIALFVFGLALALASQGCLENLPQLPI